MNDFSSVIFNLISFLFFFSVCVINCITNYGLCFLPLSNIFMYLYNVLMMIARIKKGIFLHSNGNFPEGRYVHKGRLTLASWRLWQSVSQLSGQFEALALSSPAWIQNTQCTCLLSSTRDVGLGPKMWRVGTKCDEFGTKKFP